VQYKLIGITLADADKLEDTLQWVKKVKKCKQELAKRIQEVFENIDNTAHGE